MIGGLFTLALTMPPCISSSPGRSLRPPARRGRRGPRHRAVARRLGARRRSPSPGSSARSSPPAAAVVLLSGSILSLEVAGISASRPCPSRCWAGSSRIRGAPLAGVIIGVRRGARHHLSRPPSPTARPPASCPTWSRWSPSLLIRPLRACSAGAGSRGSEAMLTDRTPWFETPRRRGPRPGDPPRAPLGAGSSSPCCCWSMPLFAGPCLLGVLTHLFITLIAVLRAVASPSAWPARSTSRSRPSSASAPLPPPSCPATGCPVFVVVPLAAVITGLVSILFALPAARVKGFYLALTTLAAQVMFPIIILALPSSWLGGLVGMPVEPLRIAGIRLSSPTQLYYFALMPRRCRSSRCGPPSTCRARGFGRALRAVRDNDTVGRGDGHSRWPDDQDRSPSSPGRCSPASPARCTAYFLQFVTARTASPCSPRSGTSAC
ncbi:MAG: hypothetical protein KatS3mg118_1432 [Paracoccaceae bacterium]|nr:MAG: hypothetical protein KatS3mg118_1432 [Paracoccaceae bacterium]